MDEDVFRGKLKQYKDTVYRIAFTYLRNQADAEDVAQETFLKFYLREKPFPDVGSEKAWLIRGDAERLPQPPGRSVWFQNRAELPENLATAFETPQDNALYAAVFSLPEKYRVVILLYYYEEYSVQEISEMLQRNPSTIQTQLERARKKLKSTLRNRKVGFTMDKRQYKQLMEQIQMSDDLRAADSERRHQTKNAAAEKAHHMAKKSRHCPCGSCLCGSRQRLFCSSRTEHQSAGETIPVGRVGRRAGNGSVHQRTDRILYRRRHGRSGHYPCWRGQ